MADTYTTNLRLVQQVNGENAGNWGDLVDAMIEMVEDAISDVQSITLSSTSKTLTTNNNAADESRSAVLDFSGTPGGTTTVTLPDVDKVYIVYNGCTDNSTITLTVGSGDTKNILSGYRELVYVKGGSGVYGVMSTATLISNDTGATAAPIFTLWRDSASPADNDIIGQFNFNGEDSGGTATTYAYINTQILDVTDTTEDGVINFGTIIAGTGANRFAIGAGLYYAGATDPGATNIAAANLYVADDIIHEGDTNNLISFGTDTQSFETGGTSRLDISDSGVRMGAANARVTTILDEDDMSSDSATALSTQQAIKAYVDSQITGASGLASEWIPAGAMISQVTNGAASGLTESSTHDLMARTFDFDQTTQEHVQFVYSFPASYDAGTVTFIPYWTADSGSGTAIWGLQGISIANDAAIDGADFGTAQTSTDTLIASGDVHVGPESSAITITSAAASVPTWFRIYRDVASDTLTADARLIGIILKWTNA